MDVTDTITKEKAWQLTLEQLKLQLPDGTYNQWLSGSQLLPSDNGVFLIGVKSQSAQDWLQNRLADTVRRALAVVLDSDSVELEFVVRGQPDVSQPEVTPELSVPQPTDLPTETGTDFAAETDFYKIWYKKGFAQVPHYAAEFWLPYLGPAAFSLWKYLDSLAASDIKYPENRWSTPEKHSYSQLARHLGSKSRRIVAGGTVECSRSLNGRLAGLPIQTDCDRCSFPVHLRKPDREGVNRCQYWKRGALEILYDERLLALEIDDSSPSPKGHKCYLQVWRVFPILTPHQADSLPADIRAEHARWLKDHQNLLGLPYTDWLNITDKTLVHKQPGYAEHRELFGHHQFNRILAELERANNEVLVPVGTKNQP